MSRLFEQAAGSRGTYLISLTVIALLIVSSVARAVIVARARRLAANRRRDVPATADEQLAEAHALAAQGAYVEAAHRLYAAVVTRLVEQRRVRRHSSKTVGDYWRELRAAGDRPGADVPRVREYVRYRRIRGRSLRQRIRYAKLEQLAAPLLQTQLAACRSRRLMAPDAVIPESTPRDAAAAQRRARRGTLLTLAVLGACWSAS